MVAPPGTRVCLLTGAGGTLGSEFCRLYAEHYAIAAVYRRRPPGSPSQHRSLLDPLRPRRALLENRHRLFDIQADLTRDDDLDRAVDLALARYDRVDVVINAAGVALDAPFLDQRRFDRAFLEQLVLNAAVPVRVAANVALKCWRSQKGQNLRFNRNVVNVSSTSGLYVYNRSQRGAYGASKAALNFLSCHMAIEYQRFGVRVNVVAPTTFPARIPTKRVARAIVRLDQSWMTGRVLVLDTGAEQLL